MFVTDGRVVSNLIVQALKGEPLTIYGDGSQTRSFCYVDDLVTGFELLIESNSSVTAPVNLGNPIEMSIARIARTVLEMTGSRSEIVHLPLPEDDPKPRRPVLDEPRNRPGWFPHWPPDSGLVATIPFSAHRYTPREPPGAPT